MSFKDHFSGHAKHYSAYRPVYPDELFAALAKLAPSAALAWDCGTGNGQAAIGLTYYFDRVIATDASVEQIQNATSHDHIDYRVVPAENSGIDTGTIDLITVAQAIHWFDIDTFAAEAERVLTKNGVLAAWTYGLLEFGDELDDVIRHLYADIVGPYWPFERKLVEGGYAALELPFDAVEFAAPAMTIDWSFKELWGYLNTWSAVKAYEQARGENPLALVEGDVQALWNEPDVARTASWPLFVRVWRKAQD